MEQPYAEALVCRKGAWAELTVEVTSVVWIRWEALGFVYLKLTIYQDERNYSGQTQKKTVSGK